MLKLNNKINQCIGRGGFHPQKKSAGLNCQYLMKSLERLKIVPIKETISAIRLFRNNLYGLNAIDTIKEMRKRTLFNCEMIRLGSTRLQTFAIYGTHCITCHKEATHFAIERHKENEAYHLNLYGFQDNGEELLFTHDHIIARSLGGADNTNNTQTMCTVCNSNKSVDELIEFKKRKQNKNNQKELTTN